MNQDQILVAVYTDMARRYGCSADDILHAPNLRGEFLSNSRLRAGTDCDEEATLRRLTNLRKRSRLPRAGDVLPSSTALTRPEAR